jgi:hypothetical protein
MPGVFPDYPAPVAIPWYHLESRRALLPRWMLGREETTRPDAIRRLVEIELKAKVR